MIDNFDLNQIVTPLQEWFLGHARILPWREEPTPHRVWISEIMLQQTRVEAVKPYYERFMKALPTVADLASCPDDALMKLWEGLGYYNRARNLKAAANQIMEEHEGELPGSYDELLTLKGIGHYTAGAVASIAFGQKVPAVDGNVLRVISRVCGDDSDIMKQAVRTHMEEKLLALMQEQEQVTPRVFNQALMELGATVCLPNGTPLCGECPWQTFCRARLEDRIGELPVKAKAKARRMENRTVLVIRDGARTAIHKRPKKGLLAGLYEFPNYLEHLSREEVLAAVEQMGYAPLQILPLPDAKHIFSHVEWHMKGYAVYVEDVQMNQLDQRRKKAEWIFAEIEEIEQEYAIPSAFAKYAQYLTGKGRKQP